MKCNVYEIGYNRRRAFYDTQQAAIGITMQMFLVFLKFVKFSKFI